MQLSGRRVLSERGYEAGDGDLGECVHADWDVDALVGVLIESLCIFMVQQLFMSPSDNFYP